MGSYLTSKPFTMKNFTLSFLTLLVTFFSAKVSAQSFAGYSEVSIIFKADSTAKSALVSNLLADRTGDQSPIMGAAAWLDSGKQLQCRSFLSFDYRNMPGFIKPEQITSAQLILNPLQLGNALDNNENQLSKFTVRRVTKPWEDSLTNWLTQPTSTSEFEVTKLLSPKKRDRTVKIDVTKIVRDMFRFGNNGFMIGYKDSADKAAFLSQWFASARNENENIRPMLVISYEVQYIRSPDQNYPALPMTARDRQELIQNYVRPEPVIVTPPTEPVKTPVKDKEDN